VLHGCSLRNSVAKVRVRSDADAAAGDEMGLARTHPCERVMAAKPAKAATTSSAQLPG